MKRKFSKEISVSSENTECDKLLIFKDRETEETEETLVVDDGVKLIAWHIVGNEYFVQTEFILMPEEMIEDYIRDFTGLSAQNFVDRFEY